jgi:hypothetical protein
LVEPGEGGPVGGDAAHCAFGMQDIEADHATLRARGVVVDAEIADTGKRRAGLVSIEFTVVVQCGRSSTFATSTATAS